MKIRLIMIGPLFALLGTVVGEAQQTVDVSKIACEQFLLGRPFDSRTTSVWLSGYFQGEQHNPVVDVSAMQKNGETLVTYCIDHPKVMLMDAAKNVFGTSK
jgi:hypothetical protein